jgi:hypothetical protein
MTYQAEFEGGALVQLNGLPSVAFDALGSRTEIYCHAIDLNQEPVVLLAQIRELAGRIAATRFHGASSAVPAHV